MTISGGLAEAETSGVIFNAVPREGSNRLHRSVQLQRLQRARCRAATTRRRSRTAGLRAPFELINVYDVSAMYGGRIVRDKLWFYGVYRQVGGERTVPGMFHNKNAGNPNSWVVDFDRSEPGVQQQPGAPGHVPADVAGDAAEQVQLPLGRAVQRRQLRPGGAARRRRRRKRRAVLVHPVAAAHATWQSPITGRCSPRPAGACIRRATASACATTARTTRR